MNNKSQKKFRFKSINQESIDSSHKHGVVSTKGTSYTSNFINRDAIEDPFLEKYKYAKMEPPLVELVVPKKKISYFQSIEESKSAYKHKIDNQYIE